MLTVSLNPIINLRKSQFFVSVITIERCSKNQNWGFMSRSPARVMLVQVLTIATSGTQTHTEVTACDY